MANHYYDNDEQNVQIENSTNTVPIVYTTLIIALFSATAYLIFHVREELLFLIERGWTGCQTSTGFVKPDRNFLINISNIGYLLQGVLMVAIPINLMFEQKNVYFRTVTLKTMFIIMACIYLLGEEWILRWLYDSIFKDGFTLDFLKFQRKYAYMFNHLCWASNNGFCIVFDIIAAGGWFLLSHDMNNDYQKTYKDVIKIIIISFVLPIAFFVARVIVGRLFPGTFKTGLDIVKEIGISYKGNLYDPWWYTKSAILIFYYVVMAFFFWYVSQNAVRYEKFACAIGSFKEIHKRINKTKNSASNIFYKRNYYKTEMEKDDKPLKNRSSKTHDTDDDDREHKHHHHHHHSNSSSDNTDKEHEHHHHHHSDSSSDNADKEHEHHHHHSDSSSDNANKEHEHHHHSDSSSGSSDGEHKKHRHHRRRRQHHHEPENWSPATGAVKRGIEDDERGSMDINAILQQEDVKATMINPLPTDQATSIYSRPGIAKSTADTVPDYSNMNRADGMAKFIQMQQEIIVKQQEMAEKQQNIINKQLEQLQKTMENNKKDN